MTTFRRAAAALLCAVALPIAAPAHATPLDEQTITLVHVDASTGSVCRTNLTLGGRPTTWPGALEEFGFVHAHTPNCASVRWTTRMTIVDQSPGRPTRAVSGVGAAGNPSMAQARQVVEYGIGVREVALVTYQYEASSRLGTVCFQDYYVVDAIRDPVANWLGFSPDCAT